MAENADRPEQHYHPEHTGMYELEFPAPQLSSADGSGPVMIFKTDHFTAYEEPELNLYALHDTVGTPFLLLAGMEPDLRWERFITAVRLLAERLGVRRVIGLGTIPMAVPHTRPTTMTAHSNDKELIADHTPWVGEV